MPRHIASDIAVEAVVVNPHVLPLCSIFLRRASGSHGITVNPVMVIGVRGRVPVGVVMYMVPVEVPGTSSGIVAARSHGNPMVDVIYIVVIDGLVLSVAIVHVKAPPSVVHRVVVNQEPHPRVHHAVDLRLVDFRVRPAMNVNVVDAEVADLAIGAGVGPDRLAGTL